MNETVNATIKQNRGVFVRSRLWWKQFHELIVICIVHNLSEECNRPRFLRATDC